MLDYILPDIFAFFGINSVLFSSKKISEIEKVVERMKLTKIKGAAVVASNALNVRKKNKKYLGDLKCICIISIDLFLHSTTSTLSR